MEEPAQNSTQSKLSPRQQFIKQFVVDRARGNADYLMERYLVHIEPELRRASYTDEKAYEFMISEYEKIYEDEYKKKQPFLNISRPEAELIDDINIVYFSSFSKRVELLEFLESAEGFKLVSNLCKVMLLNSKLDYWSNLLSQRKFDSFKQASTGKHQKIRKPNITKESAPKKISKPDTQTAIWRDIMQTEEIAVKVLNLLQDKGYIRSFDGQFFWNILEEKPLQVIVALVVTLSKKGYFKRPLATIHAVATINQFGLNYHTKNFSSENRLKAYDKFGKEFYFIPEVNAL